ncbi:MAG: flagellar biosynthesis protein FlhB [Phycisphaerae bacterium]|nr:flagellar biosynthesis protein FlhB [Phycisphaerae bacterium]
MAEETGDKTEAPTPRRRQEAREQGNIARSPDITAAAMLISSMILLSWYGPNVIAALRDLMARALSESAWTGDTHNLSGGLLSSVRTITMALAPLLIGTVLVIIVCNLAQVGLFFDTRRLTPNLAALNPTRGLGRLFGAHSGGFVRLLMSLAKTALVAMVGYSAVHSKLPLIMSAQQLGFYQAFTLGCSLIYQIIIRIGVLLLVLAIVDYIYQRFRVEKTLRMTKQEVKEEMRRMEGDPKMKQRRRQVALQRIIQRIKKDVPTADVVVTNPTHFAVALQYDSKAMHAPRVVAKGQDLIAMRIREIAVANGVPILERKPLARALYKMCNVGQEIPEEFYSTVAEILAYVYELSGKMKKRAS